METFSVLLALSAGNSPVTGEILCPGSLRHQDISINDIGSEE